LSVLYRGVSLNDYKECGGILIPKGIISKIEQRWGEFKWGRGTWGESEINAVLSHQSDSDKIELCYLSTTTLFSVACDFATTNGTSQGVVFVLNRAVFEKHGVSEYTIDDREYEDEEEVTIASTEKGFIPHEVILGAILVI
jgi:hypothetical protein